MPPPLQVFFRIVDANKNDLIGTALYNKDSIKVYYITNGVKTYLNTSIAYDSFYNRTLINPQEWCAKSEAGFKDYYIYYNQNDIDTFYLDVKENIARCNSYSYVNSFKLNGNDVNKDSLGMYYIQK